MGWQAIFWFLALFGAASLVALLKEAVEAKPVAEQRLVEVLAHRRGTKRFDACVGVKRANESRKRDGTDRVTRDPSRPCKLSSTTTGVRHFDVDGLEFRMPEDS
jgi:hypothetical protein